MFSYDGAETCEPGGSLLLSQLWNLNINIGLYRDEGLAISNGTPRGKENSEKDTCRIFNHNGLRITIVSHLDLNNIDHFVAQGTSHHDHPIAAQAGVLLALFISPH